MKKSKFLFYTIILVFIYGLTSCTTFKKVDQRQMPDGAQAKARKNIEEGRGSSLGDMIGIGKGGTNYEFSSSNPLWRASLDTLDFLPLITVDYSGGTIITDWYTDNQNTNDSIKITLRFLSNEVAANSLKIIVHQKTCNKNNNCKIDLVSTSKIAKELNSTILRKASLFLKNDKKNKKR
tara:strand:+ start:254 stop:790 length:537 start_codon:yes stop_codon:yes gene_type:complete